MAQIISQGTESYEDEFRIVETKIVTEGATDSIHVQTMVKRKYASGKVHILDNTSYTFSPEDFAAADVDYASLKVAVGTALYKGITWKKAQEAKPSE
jgi:hypothetical protein